MKVLYRGFLSLVVLLLFLTPAMAQNEKTTLRVGISNQGFSTYEHKNSGFISPDNMLIVDMVSNSKAEVKANTPVNIEISDWNFKISVDDDVLIEGVKGPIVLTPKEKIGILNLNRKGTPAYYAGLIELVPVKADKFNIVNVLDIQTYLKGVVPNEMPVTFGLEALKAQAVAARNYANRPQSAYKNYDICDSTACQVYYGINSQKEISDRAVDETKGIFALYEDEPILALYSSTAGGITEDWKNVYAYNQPKTPAKPYLVSVCDDKNQKFLTGEDEVRKFYSNKTLSYDIKSPRYRWQVEWETGELEEVLNKTLLEQSRAGLVEPKFDGTYKLEGLKDIKVLKRGNSGKALEIEISFKNGTFKVMRELGIRRDLKKNNSMLASGNFFEDKISEKKAEEEFEKEDKDSQKSESKAIFSFEKILHHDHDDKKTEKFVITGGGFGHGVGMSQYGAGYMAQNGKTFDEILKHYYSSITLGTMEKEVLYNPYGIQYKTGFYYPANSKQKVLLKVKNPKRASGIEFKINGKEFDSDMSKYSAKTLGMDITKYVTEGVNEIVFSPLSEKDKTKSITFQVEIGSTIDK